MAQHIGKAPQPGIPRRAAKPAAGGKPAVSGKAAAKPPAAAQQQQNARHVPPRQQRAAQQLPVQPLQPRSVGDLRGLLRQYGNVLTPQNKQLLQEVISRLEKGDKEGLRGIATQLQRQLGR